MGLWQARVQGKSAFQTVPQRPCAATHGAYIRTLRRWLVLTVVGWAMQSDNHREGQIDVLFMAALRRRSATRVLIHSDQGSQFGTNDWKRLCDALNLQPSMSFWDNAVVESFFSSLKKARTRDIAY